MTNLLDTIKKVTNKQVSPKPVKAAPISNKLSSSSNPLIQLSVSGSFVSKLFAL